MDNTQLIGVAFLVLALPVFLLLRHLCKQADGKGVYFNPMGFGVGAIISLVGLSLLPDLVSHLLSGQINAEAASFGFLAFFLPAFVGGMFMAHAWTKDSEILATRLGVLIGIIFLAAGLFSLLSGVAIFNSSRGGGVVAYRDSNTVGWLALTAVEAGVGMYLLYLAIKKKDKLFAGFNG